MAIDRAKAEKRSSSKGVDGPLSLLVLSRTTASWQKGEHRLTGPSKNP
jgi:hypothetical protein